MKYQFYAIVYDVAGNQVSSKSSTSPLSITTSIQLTTSLTLSTSTTKTIKINKTFTITATLGPENVNNKNVIWSTSDSSIATISNTTTSSGVSITVTGKKAGTATITAKPSDNQVSYAKTITVIITKEDSEVIMNVDESIDCRNKIFATVPTGVVWNSNNSSVATVDTNGKITGKLAGTAIITAKSSNGETYGNVTVNIPIWAIAGNKSECTGTLVQPASISNPTILEIQSSTNQYIYSDLIYNKPLTSGTQVSVKYSYTRSSNEWMFNFVIQDNRSTADVLGFNRALTPSTTSTGTTYTSTYSVPNAYTKCIFRILRTEAPSTGYYLTLKIYEILINGTKVL